ncbi:MAG: hypothetical protein KBT28_01725 [Bacteroidales bacterium]|nr:hypothetical protein [Candidatus Colimorpha merdihippi]
MISTDEGQPIWLDVCFCKNCKRSKHWAHNLEGKPYFCLLWNEWMCANDYCSKGKED